MCTCPCYFIFTFSGPRIQKVLKRKECCRVPTSAEGFWVFRPESLCPFCSNSWIVLVDFVLALDKNTNQATAFSFPPSLSSQRRQKLQYWVSFSVCCQQDRESRSVNAGSAQLIWTLTCGDDLHIPWDGTLFSVSDSDSLHCLNCSRLSPYLSVASLETLSSVNTQTYLLNSVVIAV